jgi:hypothetical protein
MPGLRKDIGTSDWDESDWRKARNWNLAFLVGWLVFFGFAIRANLAPINWVMLVPTLSIAVIGIVIQIIWLVRIAIRLDNQKRSKSAP